MNMKKKKWIPYAVFIGAALLVGVIGGIVTKNGMPWYERAIKPPFTPPSVLFPIVWTILYILMGFGMARVWTRGGGQKTRALILYGVQLVINFLWSVWFFGLQAYGLAFFWLLLLIAAVVLMALEFARSDRLAGWLQLPYILWCIFAAVLNRAVWILNR